MNRETIAIYFNKAWKLGNGKATAPVTIMVEGVHNGNWGPMFWAAHILKQNAPKWEGVPVCINHPMQDGNAISIKDVPDKIIGTVRNPSYDSIKKGIKATVEIADEFYPIVRDIEEVSAGVFADQNYQIWGLARGRISSLFDNNGP